jgi:hypothetical protein
MCPHYQGLLDHLHFLENFASMDTAMVAKTCVAFQGRVEAVIKAEGGFFEYNVKTIHKPTLCFLFQIN